MNVRMWLVALGLVASAPSLGTAQVGAVGRAAADRLGRLLGREATPGAAGALAGRVEALAARHGDDAARAGVRVGPGAIPVIEGAGAEGGRAAALLARHGEAAAAVAADPRLLALWRRHGDDAARALVRHPGVAGPAIEALGAPAARALAALSPRSARRLAMMAESGELARMGRAGELLEVVRRHGDRAMDFVWANKGALAVATTLAAFLADPKPFINGAKDLAGVAAKAVAEPASRMPGRVAAEVARRLDPTLVSVVGLMIVAAALVRIAPRRPGNAPRTPQTRG